MKDYEISDLVQDAPEEKASMSRRDFLMYSVLGVLTAAIAPSQLYAGGSPRDKRLREWMNQPVEETLKGCDYVPVQDEFAKEYFGRDDYSTWKDYQTEVFQEHLSPDEIQSAFVLYYNNHSKDSSQGLAAMARAIHEEFPQIKFCAYKLGDGDTTPVPMYKHVTSDRNLQKTPAILWYKKDEGTVKYLDQFKGGIETLDFLKDKIDYYKEAIPKYLLD